MHTKNELDDTEQVMLADKGFLAKLEKESDTKDSRQCPLLSISDHACLRHTYCTSTCMHISNILIFLYVKELSETHTKRVDKTVEIDLTYLTRDFSHC